MCIFRNFIIVVMFCTHPLSFAMLRMQRMPALKVGVTRVRNYCQQPVKSDCPRCTVLFCKEKLSSALNSLKYCHERLHLTNAHLHDPNENTKTAAYHFAVAKKYAMCTSNVLKIEQHIHDKHFYDKNSSILCAEILHLDSEIDLLKQEARAFSEKENDEQGALAQEKKIQENSEKNRQWKNDTLKHLRGEK